ncbi:MAG: response regulator [Chloroflexi bacterium]|nr:response regulator [Chloroflexota bacterium]MBI4316459.1 response regulator [Chloroflexota bacterium]MBI5291306.1 response regulator [Chloroflexota bacterium]MBI5830453.1 response regulator [Chloroflexota bacterium]
MPTKKAFVVDDNRNSAEVLSKMLMMLDIEPLICLGPREAIQRLSGDLPDVILLDVNMPGISGLEVVRYIRRDPRIANLPVIIVSSDAQTIEVANAISAGANVFLPKPVNFENLELALKDALAP